MEQNVILKAEAFIVQTEQKLDVYSIIVVSESGIYKLHYREI